MNSYGLSQKVLHGRVPCWIYGTLSDGKEGCAKGTVVESEIESMIGEPSGVFVKVTKIELEYKK